MVIDKRKKGCPNEKCEMHKKKKFQSLENDYCPKCGTKLVFVCTKCFRQIEDIDYKHRICNLCEAKEEEKKQNVINGIKKAKGAAVGIGGIIGTALLIPAKDVVFDAGKKVFDDNKNVIIENGAKIIENGINKVLKK